MVDTLCPSELIIFLHFPWELHHRRLVYYHKGESETMNITYRMPLVLSVSFKFYDLTRISTTTTALNDCFHSLGVA
jgi:hypothetical protein